MDKTAAAERLNQLNEEKKKLEAIINTPEEAKDIIDEITYELACKEQNFTPLTIDDFKHLPVEDQDSEFADHQLIMMYRTINKGRKPDYTNGNEKKWEPIFIWDNKTSGFVFSFSLFGLWPALTFVGARLCVFDEKTSNRMAQKLQPYWNRKLKPYQP